MATALELREIALAFPETEEGTSYGTPAFKVMGKLFVRVREDFETLAVKMSIEEREEQILAEPDIFFLTDHYRAYSWVLVRLDVIDVARLGEVVERAWLFTAPKRALQAWETRR